MRSTQGPNDSRDDTLESVHRDEPLVSTEGPLPQQMMREYDPGLGVETCISVVMGPRRGALKKGWLGHRPLTQLRKCCTALCRKDLELVRRLLRPSWALGHERWTCCGWPLCSLKGTCWLVDFWCTVYHMRPPRGLMPTFKSNISQPVWLIESRLSTKYRARRLGVWKRSILCSGWPPWTMKISSLNRR